MDEDDWSVGREEVEGLERKLNCSDGSVPPRHGQDGDSQGRDSSLERSCSISCSEEEEEDEDEEDEDESLVGERPELPNLTFLQTPKVRTHRKEREEKFSIFTYIYIYMCKGNKCNNFYDYM